MCIETIKSYFSTPTAPKPQISESEQRREKQKEKWHKLQLPPSVFEQYPDCANFLFNSGLAFSIVGFRETSRDADQHDLKLDSTGHPLIKVQNRWVKWADINANLEYDEELQRIKSKLYPGTVPKVWSYISPAGLVPIDRLNHEKIVPVYQLSPAEHEAVVRQAHKFYENYPEIDLGTQKNCVLQLFTTPRRQFVATVPPLSTDPIYDNLVKNFNTHIGIRVIDSEGKVYSTGIEMPVASQNYQWEGGMAKFMGTVPAKITKAVDYEEFRAHTGRLVTSIPLTGLRAETILKDLNGIDEMRLQFLRQNCSKMGRLCLQRAGYDVVDNRTTVKEVLYSALPDGKHLPFIGPLIEKIQSCTQPIFDKLAEITPDCVKTGLSYLKAFVMFIPSKISTIFVNLLILHFGGWKTSTPLKPGEVEDEFSDTQQIISFSSVIRSWTDLFKEETQVVYHSKQFIEWQKAQASTFLEPGSDLPKMAILPAPV